MLLVQTLEQYNNNHLIFCDPIKNNVMNDGFFIRILYSTHTMALNGLYLLVPLSDVTCEKYYNKFKCSFSVSAHRNIIEQLRAVEESILSKYKTTKQPMFKIYEQVRSGCIKLFDDLNQAKTLFVLKISGIWETQHHYGLTYKFSTTA